MSRCKRCGAEIVWIKTTSGKSMPCDARIHRYIPDPEGKDVYITDSGVTRHGILDDENGFVLGRISHFATCQYANGFRKRGQK